MDRRTFLTGSIASGTGILLSGKGAAASGGNGEVLKGFIVSDAHFGWENKQQPTPAMQREMMARIAARFPDLDVFMDTGDAHHNGKERDDARGLWTDIIAGGAPPVPFYYVPGNHEICSGGGDTEVRCNRLGSLSCRPYYSFDLKGIHLVSLPEMVRAVYLTKESLEWLELDLAVHADKSVILLSHNNVIGTTGPYHPGYRGIVNSEALLGILKKYPNILAWMHGHNHNFEVVEKHGMLFVSNGRIGGFDSSRHEDDGPYGLGGIYFEVTPDGLLVRSYSAERGRFLDEDGVSKAHGALQRGTTLDGAAPAAYSFGFGGARDGQRLPVYHHHAGATGTAEVFLGGVAGADFNDDPRFALHTVRENSEGGQPMLMGSGVSKPSKNYTWLNPGIRIAAQGDREDAVQLCLQRPPYGEYTYYRCPPGKRYRVEMDFDAGPGGQKADVRFAVNDLNATCVADIPGPSWILDTGAQTKTTEFDVPTPDEVASIYTDPKTDNVVHFMIEVRFADLDAPVDVRRVALRFADADGDTRDPELVIDGASLGHQGTLRPGVWTRCEAPVPATARSVIEAKSGGNRRVSWLVRVTGVDWQVRNAPVADKGGYLEVGPLRNAWQTQPEIILVPMTKTSQPFVHRLRGVRQARVYPLNCGNGTLRVVFTDSDATAQAIVICAKAPDSLTGAKHWAFAEGRLAIQAEAGADVTMQY